MPRRRAVLASSAGFVAATVAGCTGDPTADEDDSSKDVDPYTVTVEPHGSYEFDSVPESYAVIPSVWLDIGMALGIEPDAVASFDRAPLKYYDLLPDVSLDTDAVTLLAGDAEEGYDKENFYTADVDVHLIDPRTLQFYANWNEDDIAEIEEATGPFLGSTIRFASSSITNGDEPAYDLYGAFEKAAEIFQRQDQFEAWQTFYDDFISNIQAELPPEDERPSVAAIWRGVNPDSGEFRIAEIDAKANNTRTYRELGLQDAFAGRTPDGPIGYEELLDVDPDYIGAVGGLTSLTHEEFVERSVEPFENDTNGQQLTAVQNGNVVRTGGQYMGPIVDLYSTEALAKQVYPERFGEWPGPISEIPEDERLFDRQRLAEIINGEL
ncbi:ABC transporter substrate-binding protein [Halopiger djelfimassiliensis]|uniref:ABC transporter substrate-binding protein n=1 Tax=Halopiger djelfimassiliensis TaxID=1293047 RepID=UPI000677BDD1|nr:ABC transporter substrate-binding protein [Halopiger djelfimassiliensis]